MPRTDTTPHFLSSRLWLAYFFAAIAVVGGIGMTLTAPPALLGRIWRAPRRIGDAVFLCGLKVLMKVQPWLAADVRFAAEALPDDEQGTLYVSNHRSTLDVFFLLANLKGIRILSKRTLAFVPFLGEAMWLRRQIFVASRRPDAFLAALRRVEAALSQGDAVHIFPEFTRCRQGWVGTQKFSVAPFQVAMTTGARVVPLVFRGTDRVWPKGHYGLRFRRPVRVEALPAVQPRDFASPRALMEAVRGRIDAALAAPS